MRCFVGREQAVPFIFVLLPLSDGAPICVDVLGYFKRRRIPTNGRAGERDFFRAKGFAMGFGGVGAVGAAFADAGFADD